MLLTGVLDAFSASDYDGAVGYTTFSNITATNISLFNGTSMTILTRGLYWMHVSITVPAYTPALVTLSGMPNYVTIVQNHDGYIDSDTISRNNVIDLQAGTALSFLSEFSSESLHWTSFRLDNCFSPLFVFQVARSSSFTVSGQITYDLVFTNVGSAWNMNTNTFIAPLNGQYFFSLSVGMISDEGFTLWFIVNGNVVQATQAGAAYLFSQGNDLHSVSKLLSLNTGDIFLTQSTFGSLYSDLTNLQISLAGFYYSPIINSKVLK